MRRLVALVSALALLLVLAPVALGYIGQAPVQVVVTGPSGPVRCDRPVTITATVLGAESGNPIRQQIVMWGLTGSPSSADALSGSESITNARGRAQIQLSFGPVAGNRKVTARVTIVAASVNVRCVGGLPQTSLERPDEPSAIISEVAQPPAAHAPVAALSIPRLGIEAPIIEGDGVDVPLDAVAHYPGTAWPGQGSNTYLYGHARTGLFRDLWRARLGDRIQVRLADGTDADYEVTRIVPAAAWDATEYLAPSETDQLTLQTCLWYDETSPRFIVIAQPAATGA